MKGFIPARFADYIFAFYMAGIMAFLMSGVLVAVNTGISGNYMARVLGAYMVAFPIAFCCVIVVRPLVTKLVGWTIKK